MIYKNKKTINTLSFYLKKNKSTFLGFAQANTIYRDGEDVIQSYENAKRAVRTSGKFGGCPFNLNTL